MQPVAISPSMRSADDLIRLIAAGSLDPASVTVEEETSMMRSFRAKERKLHDRLVDALANGRGRIARKESERLRRSLSTRYLALWREKPRTLADRPKDPQLKRAITRAERIRQILTLLNRVGRLSEPACAVVYAKPKKRNQSFRDVRAPKPSLTSGGTLDRRVIFKFGWTQSGAPAPDCVQPQTIRKLPPLPVHVDGAWAVGGLRVSAPRGSEPLSRPCVYAGRCQRFLRLYQLSMDRRPFPSGGSNHSASNALR